jgi:endogenous inhibitor of DNA gyrase (YacG/DUF329 family)
MTERYYPNLLEEWLANRPMRDQGDGLEDAPTWPDDYDMSWWLHRQAYNPVGTYAPRECPVCGLRVPWVRRSARQRVYCSDACKMRAYRWRKEQQGRKWINGVDPQLLAFLRWRRDNPNWLERLRFSLGLGPTITRQDDLWQLVRLEARLRGEGRRGRVYSYNRLRDDSPSPWEPRWPTLPP